LPVRQLAVLLLALGTVGARSEDFHGPRVAYPVVDWDAAAASVKVGEGVAPTPDVVTRLNRETTALFPNIAASGVPVLLPFDSAALLRGHGDPQDSQNSQDSKDPKLPKLISDYLVVFRAPPFFLAGPAGYDAVFTVSPFDLPTPSTWPKTASSPTPGASPNSPSSVWSPERYEVHISGTAVLYELDEPKGLISLPTNGLEAEFPGLKRFLLENDLRYTFTRFGVPYVVSITCHDGGARFGKISCRDADKAAVRFLKALQVAGGSRAETEVRRAPRSEPILAAPSLGPMEARTIERPAERSPDFTYHKPGALLPGSGYKGQGGRADYTVYAKIRFPLREAPAFANSQSFMNWGDCDQTGRVALGRLGNQTAYRCRVNSQTLLADESAGGNYAYPWRDNFCEHRAYFVGDCPAGLGHQGQDIRPSGCKLRENVSRCEPYQHDVVAVGDGMILRSAGQQAFYVVVNAPGERVRARYLHLSPRQLDLEGVLSGRSVHAGDVVGKVGNYQRGEGATTYHLHFDLQVPTRYGWVFVNPYVTLVTAYEHLIGGRGTEIEDEGTQPSPGGPWQVSVEIAANPDQTARELVASNRINNDAGPDDQIIVRHDEPPRLQTFRLAEFLRIAANADAGIGGHDGRNVRFAGAIPRRPPLIRPMGGNFPRPGARTRHFGRDLHARHARAKARQHGI
jgi:hypothetical protein